MDSEQMHYLQCGMATPAGQKEAAAEIERLKKECLVFMTANEEKIEEIERLQTENAEAHLALDAPTKFELELRAEIARLQELLRGVGANRYWEGRWRDEVAANARLLAALKEIAENGHDVEACAYARDALRRDVQVTDGSE